jgi:outer membrane protein TolC
MTRKLMTLICVALVARLASAQEAQPETQTPPGGEVLGQERLITLSEAVALALENNLGLQVDRLNPVFADEQVREAWGAWEPSLVGLYDRQHVETPVASSVQRFFGTATNRTNEDYFTYNAGIQGLLPWGISYSTGYTLQQLESDSSFYALSPQYLATWKSEVVLPLLRDLYWSGADLRVRRSRVERDRSDEEFRARLTDTVAAVEGYYWALAATRKLQEAAKKSVDTATDLLEQTKVQYQVGTVSKVLVTQAEAGVAQREFDFIVRSNEASAAQDRLLTAIATPGISEYQSTKLLTEEPTFVPYEINAEASLEKAREQRPELAAARKAVEAAELDEKYAWNQKLPALDVRGTYTNNGLAGSQKVPAGQLVTSPIPIINPGPDGIFGTADDFPVAVTAPAADLGFPSGRAAADNDFFNAGGAHSWGVGANLVVPIGNDTLDARYVQSKILLRRAKTSLRLEEQSVIVDVRNAVRDLQSAMDGVKAAQRARAASEETLRAEQERLRLGDSTPHLVLDFEEDLRLAEGNEIRALQVYRTAIAALERAQGTLLDTLRIDVIEERARGMDQY